MNPSNSRRSCTSKIETDWLPIVLVSPQLLFIVSFPELCLFFMGLFFSVSLFFFFFFFRFFVVRGSPVGPLKGFLFAGGRIRSDPVLVFNPPFYLTTLVIGAGLGGVQSSWCSPPPKSLLPTFLCMGLPFGKKRWS